MFCMNCGTQLPDDASFCLKCGKSQKAGVQTEPPKMETCEIVRVVTKPSSWTYEETFIFAAEVIGANGKYVAFQSVPLKHNTQYPIYQKEFNSAVEELVNNLLRDNWEAVETRGENWWNYRFRRQARAETQEKAIVDVVLASWGREITSVMKIIRSLRPDLGPKAIKDFAGSPHSVILRGASRPIAEKVKSQLESVGATVYLR